MTTRETSEDRIGIVGVAEEIGSVADEVVGGEEEVTENSDAEEAIIERRNICLEIPGNHYDAYEHHDILIHVQHEFRI